MSVDNFDKGKSKTFVPANTPQTIEGIGREIPRPGQSITIDGTTFNRTDTGSIEFESIFANILKKIDHL